MRWRGASMPEKTATLRTYRTGSTRRCIAPSCACRWMRPQHCTHTPRAGVKQVLTGWSMESSCIGRAGRPGALCRGCRRVFASSCGHTMCRASSWAKPVSRWRKFPTEQPLLAPRATARTKLPFSRSLRCPPALRPRRPSLLGRDAAMTSAAMSTAIAVLPRERHGAAQCRDTTWCPPEIWRHTHAGSG